MEATRLPLCVDCDGTLIRTDLLHESVLLLVKRSWWFAFMLPLWLFKGKAYLKQQIAERVALDASTLPYNDEVIELARQARAEGRLTVLATASPHSQAQAVAAYAGVFDEVIATDAMVNLAGSHKAQRLVQRFGKGGYVYVGNSLADVPVWADSGGAVVVSLSAGLARAASEATQVFQIIHPFRATLRTYAKAVRVHQWLKNLLVFVPVLAAHQTSSISPLLSAALAFLAFGLCASGVYVINDLLDLPSDRTHARKRSRPFASGAISIARGVMLVPVLLLSAALICVQLPPLFAASLMAYFVTTCLYSFWLKNQVVVDVMLLASLYTARIIAGAAATQIVPSFWLLALSMFMFLSLAIVKRYSEMLVVLQQNKRMAAGRGYMVDDLPVLMSLGAAAGYSAILILALYVNSPDVSSLYPNRWALWMALPPTLYWISRIWMKAHRGEMHDDPVVFAASDKQSWILFVWIVAAMWMATWR